MDGQKLAADILGSFPEARRMRVIGGVAMMAHVGSVARVSRDVDVVAMDRTTLEAFLEHLRALGFVVGALGDWWRAVRAGGSEREVVDVASHPVVNPRTFETIALRGAPVPTEMDGRTISIASVEDLALLKLVSARDQDIVDLMLLAGTHPVDAATITKNAELDDAERTLAHGILTIRSWISSGEMERISMELLGRAATKHELDALVRFLDALEAA